MDRRMIAPMAIVGVAALLLLQQLWFPDSGWILIALVSRAVSTLIHIATPPEPVVKWFLDYLAWPVVLLGVVILVTRLFLARANQAMRQATPKIDPRTWELSSFNKRPRRDRSM